MDDSDAQEFTGKLDRATVDRKQGPESAIGTAAVGEINFTARAAYRKMAKDCFAQAERSPLKLQRSLVALGQLYLRAVNAIEEAIKRD